MPLEITKSLRVFIILLITVFLSNTVYAGGMMAAEQLSPTHSSVEAHHEASAMPSVEYDHHSHNDVNQDASDHCSKCTHCIACISAIASKTNQDLSLDHYQALTGTFEVQYVSIIIFLLQKPPISV